MHKTESSLSVRNQFTQDPFKYHISTVAEEETSCAHPLGVGQAVWVTLCSQLV
jgi:hypothetical protein